MITQQFLNKQAANEWKNIWIEDTSNAKTMKQLLNKGYGKIFEFLMQKDWDYGPHPFKTQSARLGKRTLRHRLDSNLMKAVIKSYINNNNNNKYKWILDIFDTFQFYLFDKVTENGNIIYHGIDLSQYKIFAKFNLCNQLLKYFNINPSTAKKETIDMVYLHMIDKADKHQYNCQLIIEVDGHTKAKYFINTITRSAMDKALQHKVYIIL